MTNELVRRRRMRTSSVLSEAWRNLTSGTTRPVLLAIVAISLLGGLAATEIRSIVALSTDAADFRASGAAVHLLSAPHGISGERCDDLNSVAGVIGAGATRTSEAQATFLTSPRSGIATVEATTGLARILGVADVQAGIWLSESAAESLGTYAGTTVPTSQGPARVTAVYIYPPEAADRTLAQAAVAAVPSVGLFDSCWVLAWPPSQTVDTLLRGTFAGDPSGQGDVVFSQLNARPGSTFDGPAAFRSRSTSSNLTIAAALGLALGAACVWVRRVELADALHAQVPKPALIAQISLELVAVMSLVLITALPISLYLAKSGNPDPIWPAWSGGMRVLGAGVLSVLLGGLLAVSMTRGRRLFRYFKDR